MYWLQLALVLHAATIDIDYKGKLGDAISEISKRSNQSIIVDDELNDEVNVHLRQLSGQEALDILAKQYDLVVAPVGKALLVKKRPASALAPGSTALDTSPAKTPEQDKNTISLDEDDKEDEERKPGRTKGGSRVLFGKDVVVKKGDVLRDAVSIGGDVMVEEGATLKGDAVSVGGTVRLAARSSVRSAVSVGGRVVLEDGVVVRKDAVSIGRGVDKSDSATVQGDTVSQGFSLDADDFSPSKLMPELPEQTRTPWARFLIWFAVIFGVGFIASSIMPQRLQTQAKELSERPLLNGLVGFLSFLMLVPLTAFLVVTCIGIPVALSIVGALMLWWFVSLAAFATRIGSLFENTPLNASPALLLLVGSLITALIIIVPYVGWLFRWSVLMIALGSLWNWGLAGRRWNTVG